MQPLTGTNFVRASVVAVRRTGTTQGTEDVVTPTFTSGTQLSFVLPSTAFSSATTFTLQVRTTSGSMTFFSPTSGNPSSGGISAAQTFTVVNPLPAITSIAPAQTLVQQSTTITITGTNFVLPDAINNNRASVVFLNGVALQTTVNSVSELTATIPAALLPTAAVAAAQTYQLTVQNPLVNGLGGGTSNARALTVVNPAPVILSLAPLPVPLSSVPLTLTLSGTNFIAGASVRVSNLPQGAQTLTAIVLSATTLTVSIPAVYVAQAGECSLVVVNPAPALAESNTFAFVVENPVPVLNTVSPTLTTIASTNLLFTLTGSGFAPSAQVILTDPAGTVSTLTPATQNAPQLTLSLPTALAGTAGTYSLLVNNPPVLDALGMPQGGGTSATLTFILRNPAPTLSAATPNILFAGTTATLLTLTGTNFLAATRVLVNGVELGFVTVNSRTNLQAVLPASFLVSATTLNVRVNLPADANGLGGGTSATLALSVRNADPILASVSPNRTVVASTSVVSVMGSGLSAVSQFRLRLGTISTVTLPVTLLTAPTQAVLTIPASAIATVGTYQITAFNPAPFGGSSNALNFFVVGGAAVSCEFVNVTTAVLSGANIASFSIRFRDSFGNLTDTPIPFVRFSENTGASSGTLTLTRSSVGVSTATVKRFYEAGDYTMWVDGMTTTTGSRSFTVVSANDNRVTFSNVPSAVNAGSVLPSFNLRFVDAFGNLTDNGVGRLTYRKSTNPVSTATLALTRLSEGLYTAQSTICTIAGTYNLAMSSIVAANTFGTKSFVISSLAAVSATFSGVTLSLNAGSLQAAFDVRFRDGYGNNTDFGVPMSVTYSNSTNATNGVSTGTIAVVRRLGIGLYEVTRATLTTAGNYTVEVSSFVNTGHRFFAVKPLAAVTAEFAGVPASIPAATALPAFTITYRDRFRNLSDYGGSVLYRNTSNATVMGSITTTATSVGVVTSAPLTFASVGNFALSVSGLLAANVSGNRGFVVVPVEPEEKCGTTFSIDNLTTQELERKQILDDITAQLMLDPPEMQEANNTTPIVIPVVVHVLRTPGMPLISDFDIRNQIDILNQDYNRLNADRVNTPPYFAQFATSANIRFCLAQTDPNGIFTTGIMRYDTEERGGWGSAAGLRTGSDRNALRPKILAPGWNPARYLNIWVTNLRYVSPEDASLGYANPPHYERAGFATSANVNVVGLSQNQVKAILGVCSSLTK